LLVFFCLQHLLTLTLLRVPLRPARRRLSWVRRLVPLPARAPPGSLLLISLYCTARGGGLSNAV
jgi:hypothetical protein